MSTSPLMTPGHSRRQQELARRRRRTRLAGAAAAVALAVALALAVSGQLSSSHGRGRSAAAGNAVHPRATAPAAAAPTATAAAAAPTVSPIGLALGAPPLVLHGVGEPQRDPLRIGFRVPPRAGLLFNLSTGRVLWQRNALRRLRIASLTKMMTALLTVRATRPNERVVVTRQAVEAAGSKVGVLPVGKRVRVETLLYGLLLPSGNDAADALAHGIAGSVDAFVARMNREAAALGLGCTRFSSPSGYFDEGNFSCAADLAVLAHVDLQQPRVARVARSYSAKLPFPIKGGSLFLYNNNPLLIYHYPGTTGLKTGYTIAAGRCLVATAQRGGVRLGLVLLHSPAPATQARQLLDLGFERVYGRAPTSEPPMPPEA